MILHRNGCLRILSVALALLAGCTLLLSCHQSPKFLGEAAEFHTSQELEQIFLENADDFKKINQVVGSSEAFVKKIDKGGEADASVSTTNDAQYFSEEEWDLITSFFTEIKPLMIMRSFFGGYNVVYFVFPKKTEDNISTSNTLFCFSSEAERDYYSKLGFVGELREIEEGWYIGEDAFME